MQEDTFPNDLNEICVNGTGNTSGIVDSDCDDTEIETPDPDPRIRIVKDDSDNHDDRQRVDIGGRARFDITVTNNGDEPLENVVIDDPRAPDCDRSASETRSLISNVGNDDAVLDPGESFNYTCDRSNVREDTFPNDTNEICVDGRGVDSGEQVNDCDPTRIFTEDDDPDIQIIKDDADNHDDRQRIISGEVRFDIAVVNSGDVSLEDVVIRDPRARECDRSASETEDLYPGRTFDPGERFGYTCRVFDVDYDDFPGGRNEICVEAEEEDGNDEVRDCDDTRIDPGRIEHGRCDRLDVNASR